MEKRNKKLLEWVGVETIIAIDNGDMIWRDKEGNDWYAEYFTNSLDACFKWLVPNLDCFQRNRVISKWAIKLLFDKEAKPAPSLCLVIEKLIDGDKEV